MIARSAGLETRTRDLALQDRELMAQHENLGVLGPIRTPTQHQQVDDKSDETVEAGHPLILIDAGRSDQLEARNPSSHHQTSSRHPQGAISLESAHRPQP